MSSDQPLAPPRLREATRGVLIDEHQRILLVKYIFPSGAQRWGTPGGGLDSGESHVEGLHRELHEELGVRDVTIGPHIWDRTHIFPMTTGHDGQRDRFFHVPIENFVPRPSIGWKQMNAEFVFDIRWWSLADIEASPEAFVPLGLAHHLRRLLTDGPPDHPIDVSAEPLAQPGIEPAVPPVSDTESVSDPTDALQAVVTQLVDAHHDVLGAVIGSADGHPIAAHLPALDAEPASVAAMASAAQALATQLARSVGDADTTNSHVRAADQQVWVLDIEGVATLTVFASSTAEADTVARAAQRATVVAGSALRAAAARS